MKAAHASKRTLSLGTLLSVLVSLSLAIPSIAEPPEDKWVMPIEFSPTDDGTILEVVPSIWNHVSTIAFISFAEVTPEDYVKETTKITADVARIKMIKGDPDADLSVMAIQAPRFRRSRGGVEVPEANLWEHQSIIQDKHFVVFSGSSDESLAARLKNPNLVDSIPEDAINHTLNELSFVREFSSQATRKQLELVGLQKYFEAGGSLGGYLGAYLGLLYERHGPSVRPEFVALIESLSDRTIKTEGVMRLISRLTTGNITSDSMGSAILIGLRGMNQLDAEEFGTRGPIVGYRLLPGHLQKSPGHWIAPYLIKLANLIHENEALVREVMQNDRILVEIDKLGANSKKWHINNDEDERALQSVETFLNVLDALR